jgi:hypothetical protein
MVVDCPEVTPVAKPLALIVAAVVLDEDQVTEPVKSTVLFSEYVPAALNWSVDPAATDAPVGVTAIEVSAAAVTEIAASPETDPDVA